MSSVLYWPKDNIGSFYFLSLLSCLYCQLIYYLTVTYKVNEGKISTVGDCFLDELAYKES